MSKNKETIVTKDPNKEKVSKWNPKTYFLKKRLKKLSYVK